MGATVSEEMIMDQLNSEVPEAVSLEQLCSGAEHELLMREYSRRTVNRYCMVWKHLAKFAHEQNLADEYSRDLALRFEEAYGVRDGERLKAAEPWRRHLVFALRILDDYARTGGVVRFIVEASGLVVPPAMHRAMRDYEKFARERMHLRMSSLRERMHGIAVFLDFLKSRGVQALDQMQPADISAFIASRTSWKAKTVSTVASGVRMFLQFLFQRGSLSRDLSAAVPKIRVIQRTSIPSVWDQALVAKMLAAVDRSSPKGKRDYAILLLAARLGMRLGDIRSLMLDDLHWSSATIEVEQAKTGSPLILPMSEEIGTGLIDYLRAGRPPSRHREVFLTLRPPFDPFSAGDHLYRIVSDWRNLAGIEFRSKQRKGLHSLRHTLATRLLQKETPFHVISAVLGHRSPASTFIYAKADVEALRSAAIDTEEVHRGQ
jgi:integrase